MLRDCISFVHTREAAIPAAEACADEAAQAVVSLRTAFDVAAETATHKGKVPASPALLILP
jgi:hypothetical protein